MASPLAQQTFVVAGVQSLQCAKDNVNLETLRRALKRGSPALSVSLSKLAPPDSLASRATGLRKILLIVDSPDEAQGSQHSDTREDRGSIVGRTADPVCRSPMHAYGAGGRLCSIYLIADSAEEMPAQR